MFWNLRRCLDTQNTAYLVIYWLGSEAAKQLPWVSDTATVWVRMKFPVSENTLCNSGPPRCHASLICCRSNYLYCFVGSFISSLNSRHLPSLSLCLTVWCGSGCCWRCRYVLYIWSAVGDKEIRSMASASSRQQLSSIQMRRPTEMVRKGTGIDTERKWEKAHNEYRSC